MLSIDEIFAYIIRIIEFIHYICLVILKTGRSLLQKICKESQVPVVEFMNFLKLYAQNFTLSGQDF